MPESVNLVVAFGMPPREAIRYFEEKGYRFGHWNWWDTWQEANARAFTIARTARMDVQQAIRNRLHQALSEGITEREFIRQLTPELQKMGWWGRKVVVDRQGRAEVVREGSPWRLKTIYRTNMMSVHAAANWKEMHENADSRPFWMYVAVMDAKTRDSHAAMHGRVFRHDDPIWDTHFPPCSFNCRCRVRALTPQQVERRGAMVESSEGRLKQVPQEVGVDKRTGEVIIRPGTQYTTPDGRTVTPSPGWSYNPGKAFYQPDLERYDDDIARQYVEGVLTGPAFARRWRHWENRVAQVRQENPGINAEAIREMFKNEAQNDTYWPVGILSPRDRTLFGTESKVVRLSDWTLAKQSVSRGGQDFGLSEYWKVQRVIEEAQFVAQQGECVYAFIQREGGLYLATIKRTRDGQELYLTSFRRSSAEDLRRLRRQTPLLRDELG